MAERAARYERRRRREWGLPEMADEFIAVHGDRVLRGPFAGLRYWRGGDAPVAKLVGAYERELTGWLAEAVAAAPPVFVDFGAADGFYAVGMKVACPAIRSIAFELSATARRELRMVAQLNDIQVDIRRRASKAVLGSLPLERALLLCDIEGAEADVLTPEPLRNTTVIVELHEAIRPGVTALLSDRFANTHTIEVVGQALRDPSQFQELKVVRDPKVALDEHRGAVPMKWALFVPM